MNGWSGANGVKGSWGASSARTKMAEASAGIL